MPTLLLDPGMTAMRTVVPARRNLEGPSCPAGPGGPDSDGFVMNHLGLGPGALGDPQVQSRDSTFYGAGRSRLLVHTKFSS